MFHRPLRMPRLPQGRKVLGTFLVVMDVLLELGAFEVVMYSIAYSTWVPGFWGVNLAFLTGACLLFGWILVPIGNDIRR